MKSSYFILLVVLIFLSGKIINFLIKAPNPNFINYKINELDLKKEKAFKGDCGSAYQLALHYTYVSVDELRFYWSQIGKELEYASPNTKKYLINLYIKKDLEISFLELLKTTEYKEDFCGIYSFRVGWCYLKGVGVEENLGNAEKYFEQSFNRGNITSSLVLLKIITSKNLKDIYYDRVREQTAYLNDQLIDDLAKRFTNLNF